MITPPKNPRNGKEKENSDQQGYQPEQKNAREGGDDALNMSPDDTHADEKVIVNEQKENKAVNAPSQTAALPSESEGNDIQ
jgi:hypothetical protein